MGGNKLTQNQMGICLDVGLCAEWTPPHSYTTHFVIDLFIGLGVRQYEQSIKESS